MIEFCMMNATAVLPNDIEELKELVRSQAAALRAQEEEYEKRILEFKNKLLWAEEKYKAMAARFFGRKSEKYTAAEDIQNRLFDEAEEHESEGAPPVVECVIVAEHQRKKSGRKAKTAALPTVEQVHELSEEDRRCACCGTERPVIGEERSSEYDLVPEHVVKIVHLRRKYGPCTCDAFACSGEREVVNAPGPAKIIKGSDFTNRTTAFFMTAKYADAIPFYRMEKMLARSGLVVTRAALSNQAIAVGRAIGELIEAMNQDLQKSPVLLMDETTVQVLKEGKGPPGKKSYMWVVRGYYEGKPIHRFAYHSNRSGSFAEALLQGFTGTYIQTDGFDGYNRLDSRSGLVHVGCFAHIRRKFVSAWETAGKSGIAKEAIDLIAELYAAEAALRSSLKTGKIDADTFQLRRSTSVAPIISRLRQWLMTSALSVAPQSALGKAISYAQSIFPKAIKFIEHPFLTPDTNAVENAIRPFVIGRKNWLFSGSPNGAHASAGIYSLIETAKANGHDPYHYLCYVFDKLPLCRTQEERKRILPYRLNPDEIVKMG
jgi:transposase